MYGCAVARGTAQQRLPVSSDFLSTPNFTTMRARGKYYKIEGLKFLRAAGTE
jgi:hypothetical protein